MKTDLYLHILKLRQLLSSISQLSYSYAQINKKFSPLENQSEETLKEIKQFYDDIFMELKKIAKEYGRLDKNS